MFIAAAHGILPRASFFFAANINIRRVAAALAVVDAVLCTAVDNSNRKPQRTVISANGLCKTLASGILLGFPARHVYLGKAAKPPLIVPAGHHITH